MARKKKSSRPATPRPRLKKFEYGALPTVDSIRILTLFPGDADAPIMCHLAAVPFGATDNIYDAVSYCWGDPTEQRVDITCNMRRLAVTTNLSDALRALREPLRPRLLWADAVCINQGDDVEKARQVRHMGEIYRNARAVRVWLGRDEDGNAEDCFGLITDTLDYLTRQLRAYGHVDDVPRLAEPYPICTDRTRWARVKTLTDLAWFSRVWVIQEVSLAKRCELRWGRHGLDIAALLELCCWDHTRPDVSAVTGDWSSGTLLSLFDDFYATYGNAKSWRASRPCIRHEYRAGLKNMHRATFTGVLRSSGRVSATDARDHLFAFLGHPLATSESGQLLVEPDYRQSLVDLYTRVAFDLLQHPREAPSVLTSVAHETLADVEGHVFPSWVPQWNKNLASFVKLLATAFAWYAAGGPGPVRCTMDEDKVLSIQGGIVFDKIGWTSPPVRIGNVGFKPELWDEAYRNAGVSFVEYLWHTLKPHWTGPEDELEHVFSVTLVREYPANKKGIGPKHRDQFLAYYHTVFKALHPDHDDPYAGEEFAGLAQKYWQCIETAYNRTMAITEGGRLGMVPWYATAGDVCCVVPGIAVPFVLRAKANGNYNLVGDSYFYGAMRGEIVEAVDQGGLVPGTIMIQ